MRRPRAAQQPPLPASTSHVCPRILSAREAPSLLGTQAVARALAPLGRGRRNSCLTASDSGEHRSCQRSHPAAVGCTRVAQRSEADRACPDWPPPQGVPKSKPPPAAKPRKTTPPPRESTPPREPTPPPPRSRTPTKPPPKDIDRGDWLLAWLERLNKKRCVGTARSSAKLRVGARAVLCSSTYGSSPREDCEHHLFENEPHTKRKRVTLANGSYMYRVGQHSTA